MRRRQFIASASATVVAASVAGCSGILGDDGGSGPEDPVEAYMEAAVEGDEEALQESLHPEATQEMMITAGILSMADDIDIQDTEVVEESEEEATVEVTYEIEAGGDSGTSTDTYVVRKHEGDWKVYSG